MGFFGTAITNLASGFIAKATGAGNRSLQGDCLDISDVGSYAAKLAKYPQCAPYLSGFIGQALPGAGYAPSPVPMSVQTAYSPPAQQMALPIAYNPQVTPAIAMLPPAAAIIPKIAQAAPAIIGAGRALAPYVRAGLPYVRKALAIASGFIVAGSLVYDGNGNLVGRTRRRRRVNPLNYRAAMRAVRRLQQLHQFNTKLEACLPTRRTSSKKSWPKRSRRKCK